MPFDLERKIPHNGPQHRKRKSENFEYKTSWWRRITGPWGGPVGFCFVAGTIVETEHAPYPIEALEKGMRVFVPPGDACDVRYASVIATRTSLVTELVDLLLEEQSIRTTREHPFWAVSQRWTRAGDLGPGDELLNADGNPVPIISVRRVQLREPVAVYNITVSRPHTYYVGQSRLLVHNKQ